MQATRADWQRIEAEFLNLASPASTAPNALLVKVDYAAAERRARAGADELSAKRAPDDVIAEYLDTAEQNARALADPTRDPRGEWHIGGSDFPTRQRWEAVAVEAARFVFGDTLHSDRCLQEWMHLVAENCPAHCPRGDSGGIIANRVCDASALMARKIAALHYTPIEMFTAPGSRQAVTREKAAPLSDRDDASVEPMPWSEIEIRFLSDHRVQVFRSGTPAEILSFEEMEMADRRGGSPHAVPTAAKPTKAWDTLLELSHAPENGIHRTGIVGRQLTQIESRVRELRRHLKVINPRCQDDPLPLTDGAYMPKFKITRSSYAD